MAHVQGEWAQGDLFPVRSSPVAAMLGLPANGKLTLTLLGKVIPVDLGVDSLERIENKINRRLPEGLRAQIGLAPAGPEAFRLTLPVAALRDAGDNDNVLEILGLLRRLPKQTLVAGREAVVVVDGKRLMASANLFEEIVPGMKITLSGTNRGVPVQVSVVLDAAELVKKMELVIEDVNRIMVALGQQQAQRNPVAGTSQAARGLQQLKESLFAILFLRVVGNVVYETPESIGIRASQTLLSLDSRAPTFRVSGPLPDPGAGIAPKEDPNDKPATWEPIYPGSTADGIWDGVCRSKKKK